MKAILLIDHGSRRDAANEMMDCMANLVQAMAGADVVVRYAHMELAELILGRAGIPVANRLTADEAARCWHSTQSATACGDACRCRPVALSSRTSEASVGI